MGENQKSIDGVLEKLALITDATQELFPDGKSLILFELNEDDFKKVQNNFRRIDITHKRFTVDISGVEVVFIVENTMSEILEIETPKRTLVQKIKESLFRKSSKSTVKN